MSSSQKTTKSTRKVQVTKTITKTGPDVSMQNLEYTISIYYLLILRAFLILYIYDFDILQGKVTTETHTDYKEINDDSDDFAGFGSELDSQFDSISPHRSSDSSTSSKLLLPSTLSVLPKSNTSTKPSSSSSGDDDENFEEDALNKHNEYRRNHGCQPLKLDKKVLLNFINFTKLKRLMLR